MNDKYIVGQYARITHMANAEDQWLVGRTGRIVGQSSINDKIASVNIAIDDTDEFVNAGDFEVLTVEGLLTAYENMQEAYQTEEFSARVNAERGNEFEAAYEQALQTIATLKESLRNIHLTASKACNEQSAALAWIESETSRILRVIPTLLD